MLGGIASVQTGAAIATTLFHRIGPSGAVLLRLLSATIVLLVIWRPRIGAHPRRSLALVGLFGLVLGAMNLTFYHALARIPLGVAVTLEFVGPLTVAVAGSRRRLDFVWVGLAALGIVALLHGDTHALDPFGVVLALLAGGAWGVYILVNARVGQAFAGGDGLALAMCAATLVAVPFGVLQGGERLLTPHALLLGCAVGMLSSAIPYSCEVEALRRIPTHVFGVLMSIEPAMAALAGFLLLGQNLSARELVGIGFVIVASLGATRRSGASGPEMAPR